MLKTIYVHHTSDGFYNTFIQPKLKKYVFFKARILDLQLSAMAKLTFKTHKKKPEIIQAFLLKSILFAAQ